jgi:mono/diheme cytochrome c family protein
MRAGRVAVALAVAFVGCAKPERAQETRGAEVYRTYCASCHGAGGRGDGTVAEIFQKPVPDLTRIAGRDGWFPDALVQRIIDGRYVAHGDRLMPVWGGRLADEDLAAVTAYLHSIQAEEPGDED